LLASQGLYVSELRRSAVSLEQYFLDLTGKTPGEANGSNGSNGARGTGGASGQQGGQA
jgi:hypothetical protein